MRCHGCRCWTLQQNVDSSLCSRSRFSCCCSQFSDLCEAHLASNASTMVLNTLMHIHDICSERVGVVGRTELASPLTQVLAAQLLILLQVVLVPTGPDMPCRLLGICAWIFLTALFSNSLCSSFNLSCSPTGLLLLWVST